MFRILPIWFKRAGAVNVLALASLTRSDPASIPMRQGNPDVLFFFGVPSKIEVAGENKPSGAGAMVMQVEHDPGGSQSRITG